MIWISYFRTSALNSLRSEEWKSVPHCFVVGSRWTFLSVMDEQSYNVPILGGVRDHTDPCVMSVIKRISKTVMRGLSSNTNSNSNSQLASTMTITAAAAAATTIPPPPPLAASTKVATLPATSVIMIIRKKRMRMRQQLTKISQHYFQPIQMKTNYCHKQIQ